MKILPLKTINTFVPDKIQQVSGMKCKSYFLISKYSTIYQYRVETLKLKKKTPVLHYNFWVNRVHMVKNRIFVSINCTLHILDFYIPLTRIKFFSKPISDILRFKNVIFLFSKEEQRGLTMNIWTLNSLNSLKKPSKKSSLVEAQLSMIRNLILFFTADGTLEILNIETLEKICSLNFNVFSIPKHFFLLDNKGTFGADFFEKKVFICSLTKKFRPFIFQHDKLEKFKKILFLKRNPNLSIVQGERGLYVSNNKGILKKIKLECHHGKIQSVDLINYKFLLTTGSFDNTMAIHFFNPGNFSFNFRVKKSSRCTPFLNIHLLQFSKIFFKIERQFKKKSKINQTRVKKRIDKSIYPNFKNLIKKTLKNELKINHRVGKLKQIIIKPHPIYTDRYKIFILFFRDSKIWFWDNTIDNFNIKPLKSIKTENSSNNVHCIGVSCKLNILTVSFENNRISFFDLIHQKFLSHGKNHNFFDLNFQCRIIFCEVDSSEVFLLSYCSHGILNLWSLTGLKIKKTLILKGLNFLKWSILRDLISISTVDFKIYLCVPQNLHIIRVFSGHMNKINGLFFINNDEHLLSFSADKTLKIWDLFENVCCDQVKFNYFPLSIWNNNKTNSVYMSHENTIGLSEWIWHPIEKKIENKISDRFSLKSFKCNEINFSFFETSSVFFDKTYFLSNKFKNFSAIKHCFKNKSQSSFNEGKLLKKRKERTTNYFKSKNFKNGSFFYYKKYLKKLKKVLFLKIKYLNIMGRNKRKNPTLRFSREFFLSFFFIVENLIENGLWINFLERLKLIFFCFLKNIFIIKNVTFLFSKHIFDLIYL